MTNSRFNSVSQNNRTLSKNPGSKDKNILYSTLLRQGNIYCFSAKLHFGLLKQINELLEGVDNIIILSRLSFNSKFARILAFILFYFIVFSSCLFKLIKHRCWCYRRSILCFQGICSVNRIIGRCMFTVENY